MYIYTYIYSQVTFSMFSTFYLHLEWPECSFIANEMNLCICGLLTIFTIVFLSGTTDTLPSCHPVDPNKLNVHLVPHSHDDVGWLKTVDQYYYGRNNSYQRAGVQYIIDSVVQALQENSDRRFIQVETAFFWQWWKRQDKKTRNIVKRLVNSGQLEIIGGAWSMNDEAAVNYQSVIDQFTLGLKTINDTLGECGRPKIGWQIDPFGHTREMASIFSQLGYDGVLFARLDYRDVDERQKTLNTELIWRGNPDLAETSDLFTSLIYRFYDAPATFCWDVLCGDEPIIEDKESPAYNLERRVNKFTDYILKQKVNYKTPNILITMGGDFTYQAAPMYYKNIDKLIKGFRQLKNDTFNLIYSTPSCYIHAVNQYATSKKMNFTLKTDDFIPYASDNHTYWTGYYTSRPNSKRFERQGNNLLQVTKQLTVFEKSKGKDYTADLINLKEIMGIMQHHDAITGTEKQHVADDYVRLLTKGLKEAESNVDQIIYDLLSKNATAGKHKYVKVPLRSCLLANVSRCEPSSAYKSFAVAVYNPLSRKISPYVRLPVVSVKYKVTGPDGVVDCQVAPSIDSFKEIPGVQASLYELVFQAKDLPPLGLKYYYVEKQDPFVNEPGLIQPEKDKHTLGTNVAGFSIDPSTGFLNNVTLNGKTIPVKQQFMFYRGANGTNASPETRASGAYIFRPAAGYPQAELLSSKANIQVYSGNLFDEIHQEFNSWVKQIIRIYKEENHIEFDWLVGPIEFRNKLGVEVISRFITDLNSSKTFYTDSNSRSLIKRIRNFRETFNYTNEEPVSGNYYPITSRIVLKDEKQKLEFAILNDRAQGGSSLKDGEVELMVHRRLKNDDLFGVAEVLDEKEFGEGVRVRGHHYLILGTNTGRTSAAQQHDLAQKKLLAPWIFIGEATLKSHSLKNLAQQINFTFSGLTKSLPENVQILTLETWTKDTLLLRLEHVFESNEDPNLSKPATVNLKDIFTLYKITSIRETTLGANQWITENKKLKWITKPKTKHVHSKKGKNRNFVDMPNADDNDLNITLNPMQIRTFIIGVKPSYNKNKRRANN